MPPPASWFWICANGTDVGHGDLELTLESPELVPAFNAEPHAIAFDPATHRLFIGSRVKKGHLYKPGKLVIMDSDSGKVIDAIDTEGGADELEFDAPTKRIYYTGTTGNIDVFKQRDADHYDRLGLVPTGAIAKTSLLVPELKRFYSLVPKHIILTPPIPQAKEAAIEDAKIMVYEVLP